MAHRHGALGALERVEQAYSPGEDRPLGSFVGLFAGYATFASTLGWAATRLRPHATVDLRWTDVARLGMATALIARTAAKDPISSPLRAPFTRFTGETSGPAELVEEVRGEGTRQAVGELISCPFCLAPWVATVLVGVRTFWPGAARAVVDTAAVVLVSDLLQYGIAGAQQIS